MGEIACQVTLYRLASRQSAVQGERCRKPSGLALKFQILRQAPVSAVLPSSAVPQSTYASHNIFCRWKLVSRRLPCRLESRTFRREPRLVCVYVGTAAGVD